MGVEDMNDIECPQCGQIGDHDVIDTDGDIEDGKFTETTECGGCHVVFTVKAKFSDIEII